MAGAVTHLDEDMAREQRINLYFRRMCAAKTTEEKHEWRELMEEEINARSPEQVARLEKTKGLR